MQDVPENFALLTIIPGKKHNTPNTSYLLMVVDTGEVLCKVVTDTAEQAENEIYKDSPVRRRMLTRRFGSWLVVWCDSLDVSLETLQRRNREWYESVSGDADAAQDSDVNQ